MYTQYYNLSHISAILIIFLFSSSGHSSDVFLRLSSPDLIHQIVVHTIFCCQSYASYILHQILFITCSSSEFLHHIVFNRCYSSDVLHHILSFPPGGLASRPAGWPASQLAGPERFLRPMVHHGSLFLVRFM